MEIEDLKALKSSLSFWRDDYDPVDDSEQHELFVKAMQAVEELIDIKLLQKGKACTKCNDTGLVDSGGVQPWGELIMIECDCHQEIKNALSDSEINESISAMHGSGNKASRRVAMSSGDKS